MSMCKTIDIFTLISIKHIIIITCYAIKVNTLILALFMGEFGKF